GAYSIDCGSASAGDYASTTSPMDHALNEPRIDSVVLCNQNPLAREVFPTLFAERRGSLLFAIQRCRSIHLRRCASQDASGQGAVLGVDGRTRGLKRWQRLRRRVRSIGTKLRRLPAFTLLASVAPWDKDGEHDTQE